MKTYDEMFDSVMSKSEKLIEKKRRRRRTIISAGGFIGLAAAATVIVYAVGPRDKGIIIPEESTSYSASADTKSTELSKYMAETLDESWKSLRGIEIISVAIASISYDEESQKLINMRNQGAMMSDPSIREGFVQSAVANGIQAAGSNANGAAAGFMGVNMGMQAA